MVPSKPTLPPTRLCVLLNLASERFEMTGQIKVSRRVPGITSKHINPQDWILNITSDNKSDVSCFDWLSERVPNHGVRICVSDKHLQKSQTNTKDYCEGVCQLYIQMASWIRIK